MQAGKWKTGQQNINQNQGMGQQSNRPVRYDFE